MRPRAQRERNARGVRRALGAAGARAGVVRERTIAYSAWGESLGQAELWALISGFAELAGLSDSLRFVAAAVEPHRLNESAADPAEPALAARRRRGSRGVLLVGRRAAPNWLAKYRAQLFLVA